jgi:hypothetical protein
MVQLLYSIYRDMHIQAHTYLYNTTCECACELQFLHMANAKVDVHTHDFVNNV